MRGVWLNLHRVDAAKSLITEDDSVMSGRPVFKGIRLPVDMVVGFKKQSVNIPEVQEGYPFLTKEQIEAADVYVKLQPPRGRSRRLAEVNTCNDPVKFCPGDKYGEITDENRNERRYQALDKCANVLLAFAPVYKPCLLLLNNLMSVGPLTCAVFGVAKMVGQAWPWLSIATPENYWVGT